MYQNLLVGETTLKNVHTTDDFFLCDPNNKLKWHLVFDVVITLYNEEMNSSQHTDNFYIAYNPTVRCTKLLYSLQHLVKV